MDAEFGVSRFALDQSQNAGRDDCVSSQGRGRFPTKRNSQTDRLAQDVTAPRCDQLALLSFPWPGWAAKARAESAHLLHASGRKSFSRQFAGTISRAGA